MKLQGIALITITVIIILVSIVFNLPKHPGKIMEIDSAVDSALTAEINDDDFLSARTNHTRDVVVLLEDVMAAMDENDPWYDRYRMAQIILKIRNGQLYEGVMDAGAYAQRTGKKAQFLYEIAQVTRIHQFRTREPFFYNQASAAYLKEGPGSLRPQQLIDCMERGHLSKSIIPWPLNDQELALYIQQGPYGRLLDKEFIESNISDLFGPVGRIYVDDEVLNFIEQINSTGAYILLQGHYASPLINDVEKTIFYSEKLIALRYDRPDLFYSEILLNTLKAYNQKSEYKKMLEAYEKVFHIENALYYTQLNRLYAAAAYQRLGKTEVAKSVYFKGLNESIIYEKEYIDGYDPNNMPGDLAIFLYHVAFPLRDVFVDDPAVAEWALPPLEEKLYTELMKTKDSWRFDKMVEYGDVPSFMKEGE